VTRTISSPPMSLSMIRSASSPDAFIIPLSNFKGIFLPAQVRVEPTKRRSLKHYASRARKLLDQAQIGISNLDPLEIKSPCPSAAIARLVYPAGALLLIGKGEAVDIRANGLDPGEAQHAALETPNAVRAQIQSATCDSTLSAIPEFQFARDLVGERREDSDLPQVDR
jgi:hypothetical protein